MINDKEKIYIDPFDDEDYDFETEDDAMEYFYSDGELGYSDDPDLFVD